MAELDIEVIDFLNDESFTNPTLAPDREFKCKYLVVKSREVLYFIYGPITKYPYHANLLNEFCRIRQIPASWIKKPDVVEVYDNRYRISGGGYLEINPSQKQLKMYGHSSAYGCPPQGMLDKITSSPSFFDNYRILT